MFFDSKRDYIEEIKEEKIFNDQALIIEHKEHINSVKSGTSSNSSSDGVSVILEKSGYDSNLGKGDLQKEENSKEKFKNADLQFDDKTPRSNQKSMN